jgi:DNA repair exonuclease SbcCD ATPase subunit
MIIFKEIRYANILATGSPFTVIRLDAAPTTLFTGKNGSGKSTFIEAITFALFNKAYRKITKPDLLNTINNKALLVELDFDIGSKSYTVRRGIKPAVFEILIDGVQRPTVPGTDDQNFLEDVVLGMNYKTFVQTVIIGKATYTPFMQLTTPQRRDIVEDLLDIRVYGTMVELLKKKLSESKLRLKDIEDEIRIATNKVDVQKAYVKTLHDDRSKKVEEARTKIAQCQAQIDHGMTVVSSLTEARTQLTEVMDDPDALNEKLEKLKPLYTKLTENVRRLNEEIKFFEEHDDCPVCKQSINNDFKDDAINERAVKNNETAKAVETLHGNIATIRVKLNDIRELNQKVRTLDGQIADENSKIKAEMRVISTLQSQIDGEQTQTGNIEEESDKLREYAQVVLDLNDKKSVETETKHYLDAQAIMLKDTGIKANVIKQYVPVMNKLINQYLNDLDFFASFTIDENFDEVIRSRARDELKYESYSEGEKLKIDMSLLFTWVTIARMKNTVATNLLIFDEVTDAGLDTDSSGHIVSILKHLAKSANVFVITHHPDLYIDKFDRNVRFAKVNNYSILLD